MMIFPDVKSEKPAFGLAELLLGKGNSDGETFGKMLEQFIGPNAAGTVDPEIFERLVGGMEGKTDISDALLSFRPEASKQGIKNELLTLLKGEDMAALESEIGELRDMTLLQPKLLQSLDISELKTLIVDAKNYLKAQIGDKVSVKEMPQTLRGLVELAEKVGVDLTKVTLQSVREVSARAEPSKQSEKGLSNAADSLAQSEKRVTDTVKSLPEAVLKAPLLDMKKVASRHTTAQLVEAKTQQKSDAPVPDTFPKPLESLLRGASAAPAQESVAVSAAQTAVKLPEPEAKNMRRTTPDARTNITATDVKAQDEEPEMLKPVVAKSSEPGTTASARTMINAANEQTPRKENLFAQVVSSLLGKGEETAATSATAAAAETAVTEPRTEMKTEIKNVAASQAVLGSNGLDLKIKEAKQTVRHFAEQMKEAVENYRPPFTRLKIQLNPAKMGEVDVTMIQRGNNVHINISSNANAIITLAQNATELKAQLANNGLANATMHFNSNGGEQQRQQQNRQRAQERLEQYENEENYELLSSLELVVPHYV